MTMTDPPFADGIEAAFVRLQAARFSHAQGTADQQARDHELLHAAITYGRTVIEAEIRAAAKLTSHKKWRCKLCGRDNFVRRCAHTCNGQHRKRHLKWEPVYG